MIYFLEEFSLLRAQKVILRDLKFLIIRISYTYTHMRVVEGRREIIDIFLIGSHN